MVKKLLFRFYSNPFIKNVSTLAVGTVISQLVLLIASPILTRLYSAANFGVLALFTSISTIAAILTTGRYELAIGLPKEEEDAANVTGLVVFIGLIISIFYCLIILLIKVLNLSFTSSNELTHLSIFFLIPIYTFSAATASAFQYWNQRQKKYTSISISNFLQALGVTLFNLFFGFIAIKSFGLIYSLLIGQVIGIIVLLIPFYKSGYLHKINIKGFKSIALEYIGFPKYMIVSDISSTTSQQIIPIIFSILFNSSIVGYFSLANRMLRVPSIVLTSSIGSVFRNDAIDSIRLEGNCKLLYISTIKKLLLLCAPIYIFFAVASPWLFSIFFGSNWIQAGYFARIICIMMIFDFMAVPLNSLFYVLKRQKIYMRLQFANTVFGILFIYLGFAFFKSAYYSILFFAINSAVFDLISLKITYNLSKYNYKF